MYTRVRYNSSGKIQVLKLFIATSYRPLIADHREVYFNNREAISFKSLFWHAIGRKNAYRASLCAESFTNDRPVFIRKAIIKEQRLNAFQCEFVPYFLL